MSSRRDSANGRMHLAHHPSQFASHPSHPPHPSHPAHSPHASMGHPSHSAHGAHMAHPSYSQHPATYRDPREARDSREMRDPREVREARDPRDMRDMRDVRELRDAREARDPRDVRDVRDIRDVRDVRESRDMRDHRDPRDLRDIRDPREARDPREMRDPRDARDMRDPRDVRDPRDIRDPRDPRDPREIRHSNGTANGLPPGMTSGPAPIGGPAGPGGTPSVLLMPGAPPPGAVPPGMDQIPSVLAPAAPLGPPGGTPGGAMVNGHARGTPPVQAGMSASSVRSKERMDGLFHSLAQGNENTWLLIGAVAEQMQDPDRATAAFEHALRHNPNSIIALNSAANIARNKDDFGKAIDYFQRILNIKQDNGEVWGSMGHCLLMKDDLPKAYTAYQQALYHLQNPKEPKLWYGIGILYDRYGSFEHAEEAFSSVLKMDPGFEKANEIYFRLGIIYKHQRRFKASLDCFRYILDNPPRPLTSFDIWFQLGHVYEQNREYDHAREAYSKVLAHQPDHAKVLQQLGWLYHQPGASFADHERAVSYLTKSLETDGSDAQSWYLLGRAFMAGQRYNKAYEAYQQAVYRDGRNPTFWCSIGVLYYQINQYRDALDAYSRAIRLNPYISEVWYNLGSLYESCNNQVTDAIDAYSRAAELDPTNGTIKHRLQLLQTSGPSAGPLPPAPGPVDVHPSQYAATPNAPGEAGESPQQGADGRMDGLPGVNMGGMPGPAQIAGLPGVGPPAPGAARDLPPPPSAGGHGEMRSPGPFRGGGAPPPLNNPDESRGNMSRLAPLAPMDTDRTDRDPMDRDRDPREREMYRDAPRFDERDKGRRGMSPSSPQPRPGYPSGYPGGTPAEYGRDREPRTREEWEARERERRLPLGPPGLDPRDAAAVANAARGPSPRVPERMYDPLHPSPRMDREYRETPGHPCAPGSAERERYAYDRDRERERERDRERGRYDEAIGNGHPQGYVNGGSTPGGNGFRHPSMSRDGMSVRHDDARAVSPVPSNAPSNSSRAGGKRARARDSDRGSEAPKSAKRAKDEMPQGRKVSAAASASGGGGRGKRGSPEVKGERPRTRSVEEEYDEGIEALMALHGDRPASLVRGASSTPAPAPAASNIGSSNGSGLKRQDPPSPAETSARHEDKRAKADMSPTSASAVRPALNTNPSESGNAASRSASSLSAGGKKMVIEVLNAERINTPTPLSETAPELPKVKENEPESASASAAEENGAIGGEGPSQGEGDMDVDAPKDAPTEQDKSQELSAKGGNVDMDLPTQAPVAVAAGTNRHIPAPTSAEEPATAAPTLEVGRAVDAESRVQPIQPEAIPPPVPRNTAPAPNTEEAQKPVDEEKDELESRPATPPVAADSGDGDIDMDASAPAANTEARDETAKDASGIMVDFGKAGEAKENEATDKTAEVPAESEGALSGESKDVVPATVDVVEGGKDKDKEEGGKAVAGEGEGDEEGEIKEDGQ